MQPNSVALKLCAMPLGSVAFCNPARVAFLACNPESCRERNYTARVAQCNPLRCIMQLNFSQCLMQTYKLTQLAVVSNLMVLGGFLLPLMYMFFSNKILRFLLLDFYCRCCIKRNEIGSQSSVTFNLSSC
uniref:G_PROTEIN_RECEP_F1_2 domain-containing protein n=1 Tax=Panagrellus redivivus TaxID=6233 RepID=A0A7E4VNB4_PANRE